MYNQDFSVGRRIRHAGAKVDVVRTITKGPKEAFIVEGYNQEDENKGLIKDLVLYFPTISSWQRYLTRYAEHEGVTTAHVMLDMDVQRRATS